MLFVVVCVVVGVVACDIHNARVVHVVVYNVAYAAVFDVGVLIDVAYATVSRVTCFAMPDDVTIICFAVVGC